MNLDLEHHQAGVVAMLAGLYSLAVDGGKVLTAFFVAVATGAGYRLGVWIFQTAQERLRARAKIKSHKEQ